MKAKVSLEGAGQKKRGNAEVGCAPACAAEGKKKEKPSQLKEEMTKNVPRKKNPHEPGGKREELVCPCQKKKKGHSIGDPGRETRESNPTMPRNEN